MKPVVINGEVWTVRRVPPGDPLLVDRTGTLRIATTDPLSKSINIAGSVMPPLLDMVVLHEVTHAITDSHNLIYPLRMLIPPELWITVEEWSAELMEHHGIEAITLTSKILNRPPCIMGYCMVAY